MSLNAIINGVNSIGLPFVADNPTIGDGNCFFNAIIQQLTYEGNCPFVSPLDLRHKLVQFVSNSPILLESESYCIARNVYIQERQRPGETVDATWFRVLTSMSLNGTWADDIFISCMSTFLQRQICLTSPHHKARVPWTTFHPILESPEWRRPITLGMIPNVHFQSLLPKDETSQNTKNICLSCGFKTDSSLLRHLSKKASCMKFYDLNALRKKKLKLDSERRKNLYKKRKNEELLQNSNKKKEMDDGQIRYTDFKNSIKLGPVFVCFCCDRCLFRDSVRELNVNEARNIWIKLGDVFGCAEEFSHSDSESLYLCHNCSDNLKRDKVPSNCFRNGLYTEDMPTHLMLNELGATMIAKNILFLKIFHLPRSRWNALKDRVINVQVDDTDILSTLSSIGDVISQRIINVPIDSETLEQSSLDNCPLPCSWKSAGIIPVQLKRKLNYKNTVLSSYVDPAKLMEALLYFKKMNHPGYSDIKVDASNFNSVTNIDDDSLQIDIETEEENGLEVDEDNLQPTMFYDNFPEIHVDSEEINTSKKNDLGKCLNIAPGEGKIPANIMRDDSWDINAFPILHPSGRYGLNYTRLLKLSSQKYFCQRILNKNPKFATYPPWLFAAVFYTERYQLEHQVNINYRKGFFQGNNILQIEDGFEVFNKIPGTPKYWQQKRYEMVARLEQLRPFQFFFTLSCADKRWKETLIAIFQNRGESVEWTSNDLNEVKINGIDLDQYLETINLHDLIKQNVPLLTRCFDKRVHAFIKHVICGKNSPMNVEYYNYRAEFQLRGAGHIHGVVWVDFKEMKDKYPDLQDAFSLLKFGDILPPKYEEVLVKFTDSFVTCSLDSEAGDIAAEVQCHSHSKSCKKYGTNCRFNYPKFPSEKTFITYALKKSMFDSDFEYMKRKKEIQSILDSVKTVLEGIPKENLGNFELSDVLNTAGIDCEKYYNALKFNGNGTGIILKRKVAEIYINNFNPEWLKY